MTIQPSPANMGITPTTSPEVVQVLDNSGNWVEVGTVAGGIFTPVGGGGGGGGVPEAPTDGNQYGRQSAAWTIVTGSGGGVPEAPTDHNQYGRQDAGWTIITGSGGSAVLNAFDTLANIQATNIPATMQNIACFACAISGDLFGRTMAFKRVATGSAAMPFVRSADRFLPNGTTDATNGGYWKLTNNIVMPEMFGAKRDGVTDDYAAIQATINYIESVLVTVGPETSSIGCEFSPGVYQCSTGLLSQNGARYTVPAGGDVGANTGTFTCIIRFPAAFAGPYGWRIKNSGGGNVCTIENISLQYNTGAIAGIGVGPTPSPINAWQIEKTVRMKSCCAAGWPGNGFFINGASDGSGFSGVVGFVDGANFDRCLAQNNGYNGFFGYGQDYNICTFYMCSAIQNLQFGFRDIGFLGNVYINCHTSANALHGNPAPGVVVYPGPSTFNGTISGTTLTVNVLTSGTVAIGQVVTGGGSVLANTVITANIAGSGSGSTWTVSVSQSVGPISMAGNGKSYQVTPNQNGISLDNSLFALTLPSQVDPVTGTSSWAGNGTISGTTLTINSTTSGAPNISQLVTGSGVAAKTMITAGSGTTWTVNNSQTVGPVAMSGSANVWTLMFATPYPAYTPWVSGTNYQAGGPYSAGGTATFIGCYTEGGQPFSWILGTSISNSTMGGIIPYVQQPLALYDAGLKVTQTNVAGGLESVTAYYGNGIISNRSIGTTAFQGVQGTVSGTFLYQMDPKIFALNCQRQGSIGGWYITSGNAAGPTFGRVTPPAGLFTVPGLGLGYNSSNLTFGIVLNALPSAPGGGAYDLGSYAPGWFTYASGAAASNGNGLLGWQCIVAGSPGTQLPLYGAQAPIYGSTAIASLPAASTAGAGARAFVNNSSQTASGNFGAALSVTTGANKVPVYSDGAGWFIG